MLEIHTTVIVRDSKGREHTLCLLEAIAGDHLVLMEMDPAEQLIQLQERSQGAVREAMVDLIAAHALVMDPVKGRFLPTPTEKAHVLAKSEHHLLRLVGLRMEDLPEKPASSDLAGDFLRELKRRAEG
jgi:hypothetical protein